MVRHPVSGIEPADTALPITGLNALVRPAFKSANNAFPVKLKRQPTCVSTTH